MHSTPYAVQLGSLTLNLNGLATIRQLVTIPTGYSQNTLGVWIYTQAQSGTDADFQEIALLELVRHNDVGQTLGGPAEQPCLAATALRRVELTRGRPSLSASA